MTEAETPREKIVTAALAHVPFDGWSMATLDAAADDAGIDRATAHALFPRGAVDLALAWHERGDALMLERLRAENLGALRFRDRIAMAVRMRIEAAEDREAVRRGATLFALPMHAADGSRAIWNTVDLIWTVLGDTSDDLNWYTKRATLAAVYSATVLYWLGDDSPGYANTWAFLDRRIEDVMRFESAKAAVRKNPVLRPFLAGPEWLASRIRAPRRNTDVALPGHWGAATATAGTDSQ
jgi:ubiquinone biosynthesis protein COQ9